MTSLILSNNLINGQEGQLNDWGQINWRQVKKVVRNLQQRIFRARKKSQWKQLRRLQKLLLKSYANLLLSVRQITQVNTGKRTAGVDKEVITTPDLFNYLIVTIPREAIASRFWNMETFKQVIAAASEYIFAAGGVVLRLW
jgi:hypothetical protein